MSCYTHVMKKRILFNDSNKLSIGQKVVVTEYGQSPMDAVDKFIRLQSQKAPDFSDLTAKDVIIAVRSASVGWVDLIMASGQYQHMAPPPYIPGLEYAGDIAWAGSEAVSAGFQVGDRVLADCFQVGPRSSGAYREWGGFANWAVAPLEALRPVPEGFSYDQACNFFGSYETAYHGLIARGQLKAGETVLILGASGSTGLAAVHIAKLLGATVIATGRNPEKLAFVKDQGADHILNTSESSSMRDKVKALTEGRGVNVVYDTVGGDISHEAIRCVSFGARYLVMGWAATPDVARGKGGRGAPKANMLPTNLMMMKGLDVLGCPTVISTVHNPAIRRSRVKWLLERAAEGRLRPYISHTWPLSDVQEALRAKFRGNVIGGAALHPPTII